MGKKPLPGSETLTMGDQLSASRVSDTPRTSPADGSVKNPRREFLKNRIQQRANAAQGQRRQRAPFEE